MVTMKKHSFLFIILFLLACGDLFHFGDDDKHSALPSVIDTTVNAISKFAGDKSFSVVFYNYRSSPVPPNYVLENLVLNSSNYADTVCCFEIEAHDTVRINYQYMAEIDMDIILTGDAFPNKINNIKQNDSFNNEIRENKYYYRQYSVINDRQLDTLVIYTKNVLPAGLDDFKAFLQSEGLTIYLISDHSQSIGMIIYTIMTGGFTKSILKRLILNEKIKYIHPRLHAVPG